MSAPESIRNLALINDFANTAKIKGVLCFCNVVESLSPGFYEVSLRIKLTFPTLAAVNTF